MPANNPKSSDSNDTMPRVDSANAAEVTGEVVEQFVGGVARLVTDVIRDSWEVSRRFNALQLALMANHVQGWLDLVGDVIQPVPRAQRSSSVNTIRARRQPKV